MAANSGGNPATHFGRQMKKERLARGWSLREFSARTGISFTHLSRIENGHRPPTEAVAEACDRVFPERHGWFLEYYEESKSWTPAAFRSWGEYEDKAATLRAWSPGVLHGLVQTEAYARALLETASGATAEMVTSRLAGRMERQKRVLLRENPPTAWFVVDELSLYREVGSAQVMADQMRSLADVAAVPNVVVQVLPAVAHPAGASGFIVADDAAYAEHVVGGYTFTEQETVTSLLRLFSTIHSESFRASESLKMLEGMAEAWMTGVSPLTRTPTAETV
jgi:transcriptional regulator with XRE-family HTH domain